MTTHGNLNKFKHKNKNKRRKNPNATFDKNTDEFGIVTEIYGNEYIGVQILDGRSTNVKVRIPGKFRKKVWLRKGDPIVITKLEIWEVKGRVNEIDMIDVKTLMHQQMEVHNELQVVVKFESSETNTNQNVSFKSFDSESENESPADDDIDDKNICQSSDKEKAEDDEIDIDAI